MKLVFWEDGIPINFGEKLNTIIWKKMFPEHFFHTKDDIHLLVLSSGIFQRSCGLKPDVRNVVFGSGTGYFLMDQETLMSYNNKFIFVRGPLTANVVKCRYITDPAVLLKFCDIDLTLKDPKYITFTNHWTMNYDMDRIHDVLKNEDASYNTFKIGASFDEIIESLKNTRLLVTCSLHAAIIADLMGIPWVPFNYNRVKTVPLCYFKWCDWAYSMNLNKFEFFNNTQSVIGNVSDVKRFISDFKNVSNTRGYLSDRNILRSKCTEILEEVEKFKIWFNEQP